MLTATDHPTTAPPADSFAADQGEAWKAVEVLEELLANSIQLRDLYKNARWQTASVQYRRLRQLFDDHYKEQIHLIDSLIERIRALDAAGRVFAGGFLQSNRFSQSLHGRASITLLLDQLLDSHESVLTAARSAGTHGGPSNDSWTRDLAVGQVVLTNNQQILAIREQMMHCTRMLQARPTWVAEIE
jgi:starvation-inducible DNA-binding protein